MSVIKPIDPWNFEQAVLDPSGRQILFKASMSDKNGRPLAEDIRTVGIAGKNERVWYRGQMLQCLLAESSTEGLFSPRL